MNSSDRKFCAILLNMGGPGNLDDIKKYLYNIFTDRDIIRLPGGALMQKPFARMISSLRYKKVQDHYKLIGGGSPLYKWTKIQADKLEAKISSEYPGFKCYIGMRYFDPYTEDAIRKAIKDGFKRIILFPQYPQFSTATTGSSFNAARRVLDKADDVEVSYINDFHNNELYISLLKDYIDQNIKPGEILLYSAHSLPQKFVDEGDPYVDQIKRTAKLAAGDREYYVSFQSRTGPVDWVGPDTIDEVKRLLSEREESLFIVPISFISDHIETLYEIDIELKEIVGEEYAGRIRRMPMFNDDDRFADVLAGVIRKEVAVNV